ncbi:hypothetical protein [Tetragenococcus halophilus]|uniref:Uncharacterized protein n=1 Tax=Tetragenococcus halophilus (strain DSM 20338 / JCM 20259 / NCIMB 9735 / NBRC 12172) TaxID=945021 RepID=A0AAN1VRJ5_TETHN|nr:hypothetical protein [Tetragenococcus halophilus]BAK95148.1 hypothetical protein TEH_18210 [Tetragenococcus halophilus NBRC 12172]GBD71106.1 putative uncharacterized protein [Tetragenococcus halophilus subsp. halophilus]
MSELLDESRQRKDKAIEDKKTCGNGLSYGLFKGKEMAWQEAIDLIEKHEKPKGLLHYVPKLTDKQQGIYTELKYVYQSFCCVVPDDKDNTIVSICNILEGTEDHDAIPVLKKFLSEVEE